MSFQNFESKKILLVCAPECTGVEEHLVHAGCLVTKVSHGTEAVEGIKHCVVNAVVIISTGSEMDLAETALNLRDINPSVEIIILADRIIAEGKRNEANAIARVVPKIKLLTVDELDDYLRSARWRVKSAARSTRQDPW